MILEQDPDTGYWTQGADGQYRLTSTHDPAACEGRRLCDIHNRRGERPWSFWLLDWREDRGMMEIIDPYTGIGHPSPAQVAYWQATLDVRLAATLVIHGCDGGCFGAYDQIEDAA